MSATLSRLILSMAVILGLIAIYMPVYFVVESSSAWLNSNYAAIWITDVVCGGLFVAGWILTWRSHIRWTPRRVMLTVISVVAALIPAVLVAAVTDALTNAYSDDAWIVIGGMIWGVSWLALTALIWRETAAERGERLSQMGIGTIACPSCGYNLTGLKEARCPECGAQYTLDQLLASALEQHGDLDSS